MFECVIAIYILSMVNEHFNISRGSDCLSIAKFWLSNKNNSAVNVAYAASMWCLWETRNSMIFNNATWISIKLVIGRILRTVKLWMILSTDQGKEKLETFSVLLAMHLKGHWPSKVARLGQTKDFWHVKRHTLEIYDVHSEQAVVEDQDGQPCFSPGVDLVPAAILCTTNESQEGTLRPWSVVSLASVMSADAPACACYQSLDSKEGNCRFDL